MYLYVHMHMYMNKVKETISGDTSLLEYIFFISEHFIIISFIISGYFKILWSLINQEVHCTVLLFKITE